MSPAKIARLSLAAIWLLGTGGDSEPLEEELESDDDDW